MGPIGNFYDFLGQNRAPPVHLNVFREVKYDVPIILDIKSRWSFFSSIAHLQLKLSIWSPVDSCWSPLGRSIAELTFEKNWEKFEGVTCSAVDLDMFL